MAADVRPHARCQGRRRWQPLHVVLAAALLAGPGANGQFPPSALDAQLQLRIEQVKREQAALLAQYRAGVCIHPDLFVPYIEPPMVCTTTTTTSLTSTSTSTTVATVTETTTRQHRECKDLCFLNSHPWFVKCGWWVCSTCEACENVVLPTTKKPVVYNFSFGSVGGEGISTPEPEVYVPPEPSSTTTSSITTTEDIGPSLTLDPEDYLEGTTTVGAVTLAPHNCLSSCSSQALGWEATCTWALCSGCIECQGTTTTSTVSISTTSTSATGTTTTASTTTTWNGTSTTTSLTTVSSTTSTTVTTRTDTASTTSTTITTTAIPCDPPGPLFPTLDCQHNITSGDRCVARTLDHPCVTQSILNFICPEENVEERPAILESGDYSLRCQVCTIRKPNVTDEDPEEGMLTTSLEFGPNLLEGNITEDGITGYFIYFADNCSRKLGPPLEYLEALGSDSIDLSCCQHDLYAVELKNVALPVRGNESSAVRLMVVPNTVAGELSAGMTTEDIVDHIAEVVQASRPVTSFALSQKCRMNWWLAFLLISVATLHALYTPPSSCNDLSCDHLVF